MIRKTVSWLLWLANSDPPFSRREGFYGMKERILRRWGSVVGHDWQEITKHCYRCEGGGEAEDRYGDMARCGRCGGSGIYDRFWVHLERWEFEGRIFHRPANRTWKKPDEPVTIRGLVEHADVGRAADEAALWLALFFNRPLFRQLMLASHACGPTWRYPLVTLQKVTCRLGMLWHKLERRQCSICGCGFRQGWRAWRSHSFVCGPCSRRRRLGVNADDDIPF